MNYVYNVLSISGLIAFVVASMLKGEKIVVPFRYAQDALSKNITVETYTL